ncbi:uncharacterized protein LOC124376622 isoform X2 [Silurus meridionalis]|uniref:uncharacterized protein LOC124376622 isoform X2 n=1 Tax=Silurus meridionalis TaxID=175797 RepID=UPI001EEB47EC|nr:uncharacterized protein LOC124376622 isoform X2 [Silurus meridionalis]
MVKYRLVGITTKDYLSWTEVHSEKISPEGEKSTSAENGVVQTEVQSPFHSLSPVAEEDTQTHEDGSRKEEELEFPHDLLPSIDLSTELNLTWGASFSQNGAAVSKENASLLQLQSAGTIQENAPSHQSSATLLDRELQEAIQECEEQIASFGMSSHSISSCSTDQIGSRLSEAMSATDDEEIKGAKIREDPMSFPILLADSQTGCYQSCHGDVGAQATDLASFTEQPVFCFRDYILGKTQPEQATVQYPKEHSEKLLSEPMNEFQIMAERETNTDSTKSADRNEHLIEHDSTAEAVKETELNEIHEIQAQPEDVSLVDFKDSANEEDQTITYPVEKTPEPGTQIITTTAMDKTSLKEFITENVFECNWKELNTQPLLESEKKAQSITKTKAQSETNPDLKTEEDNQIELLDKIGQMELLCSLPPESLSNQAHLTPLEATTAPTLDHLQTIKQQDISIGKDGSCKSISEHATLNLNSTREAEHEKCVITVSTGCTVIDFRDVKGKTHEHEKGCSSEACPLEKKEVEEEENVFFIGSEAGTHTVVRGKSHSLSSTGTKGIKTEEESALEEASASAVDFTPPLMTSTMPEMRECEGVGEKGTGDLERVKMTEKGYLDEPTELQETNKSLCSHGKPNKIIAAEVHSFSLSFPQTNNSPAKDAKEAEAASEVRWSSKMLQNSEENEENEEKGGGLLVDCSLGMDSLSAAGEKETGTASVRDMTVVAASTTEFNDGCDWKRKSSESLEKGGEGGTEEGRGKERGGAETLYREQALSLTEAKSYPLHDNGLKLVPPQQKDELVTLTTADIANTALPLLTNNKTTASSLYNPSSPDFLPNSTDTESEEASEIKDRKNKSLNALDEKQPDSNNLHLTAASANLTAQTSYQQVQNTSSTQIEISSTQQNKAGTAKDTSYKTENQHLSSTSQLDKWSTTASFNKVNKGTGGSQEDMPRQVTGFASLPPLTFHENLWHPVSESSFNFQGLFGNKKPDPPQKTAYTTCESTSVAKVREENMTVNENPEKQIDVKIIHDLKDKTANNLAMSAEELLKNVRTNDPDKTQEKEETLIFTRSTLEHKPPLEDTNENRVKLQDNVLEEIGSDKVIGLSDLVLSNEDRNSAVVLTTKEVNEKVDKLGESDVKKFVKTIFRTF